MEEMNIEQRMNYGPEMNNEQEFTSERVENVPPDAYTIDLTEGEDSDAHAPFPMRKKQYKISSSVWSDFERICKDGKVEFAICKYCKIKLKCLSTQGISTLTRHLNLCKYNTNRNRDKGQQLLSFTSASLDGSGVVSNWRFDQDACRRAMTRMIIIDELPFKFAEKDGFREFCKVVQPLMKNVSRTTIVRETCRIYKFEKSKLQKLFNNDIRRVCLTTDLWTSNQNIEYLCLTAHFIDSGWKLHKRIINFCILPSPHTGEAIARAIEGCLNAWNIKQVCTVTVDNASANDVAISTLRENLSLKNGLLGDGECIHVRCVAQILNFVVKEGCDQIKDSISRIRNSVKYIKSSSSREQIFQKSCENVLISTKMSLCLDVSTCLNSTYLMLKHALPFEKAFKRFESDETNFKSSNPPVEDDWKHVKVLCDFLAKFHEAIKILSGTKYVTSSLVFHQFDNIQESLNGISAAQDSPLLLHMCTKMKEKLAMYWGSIDKMNVYLLIAFVLDPRYKLDYLEWCLQGYLPVDEASAISKKVYDKMVALYKTYQLEALSMHSTFERNVITSETKDEKYRKYMEERQKRSFVSNMTEIDAYLNEAPELVVEPFDILAWWSTATKYRTLACMARDILAIPVSIVASESAFGTGGCVLDQYYSSLTPMLVECLICTQDWLKISPKGSNYEEFVDELERCVKEVDEASSNRAPLPPFILKH